MAKDVEVPKGISQEDLEKALNLLNRNRAAQERAKEKRKTMTPEERASLQERGRKQALKNRLYIQKAKEAGITVTDAEVDAAFKASRGK